MNRHTLGIGDVNYIAMDYVRRIFPYGMRKLSDGSWILFNRYYAPAGTTLQSVNMNDACYSHHRMVLTGLGPATRRKLSHNGKGEGHTIYFYNDGCQPEQSKENWTKYMAKLKILMRLSYKL